MGMGVFGNILLTYIEMYSKRGGIGIGIGIGI